MKRLVIVLAVQLILCVVALTACSQEPTYTEEEYRNMVKEETETMMEKFLEDMPTPVPTPVLIPTLTSIPEPTPEPILSPEEQRLQHFDNMLEMEETLSFLFTDDAMGEDLILACLKMVRYFGEIIEFRQFVHEAWFGSTYSIEVLRVIQEVEERMVVFWHEICIKEFYREVN